MSSKKGDPREYMTLIYVLFSYIITSTSTELYTESYYLRSCDVGYLLTRRDTLRYIVWVRSGASVKCMIVNLAHSVMRGNI